MSGIYYSESAGKEQDVHLLLTEYAKDCYVLVICTKDDGNSPREVLLRIKLPDEKVTFDSCEKSGLITVTNGDTVSCICCNFPADFWEIMRIVSTAKRVEAVRELAINALVDDAIKNIPDGVGMSAAGGVQLQNSVEVGGDLNDEEDEPEEFEMARDTDEETVVG